MGLMQIFDGSRSDLRTVKIGVETLLLVFKQVWIQLCNKPLICVG